MIRYECDRCGKRLTANDSDRFIVRIEVYAAAGPLDLSNEISQESRADELSAVIRQLSEADPNDIEDRNYRRFRFDFCGNCHQAYLAAPLRRITT